MLPYWIFFFAPAMIALASSSVISARADGMRPLRIDGVWILIILLLSVVIGFRYNVGGDWQSYLFYLAQGEILKFSEAISLDDPGYRALNYFSAQLGFGITGVNTFGAFIFSIGLVLFCRNLPRPWLGLACAMPYLVTVVAMGYTRQSIALGFVMIGFVMLGRRCLSKKLSADFTRRL